MVFPSSTDSFQGFTSTDTLAIDNHAAQHNQEQAAIVALENKFGTGVSTPTSGVLLRGNGVGTSTWAQANLSTDVTGILGVSNGGTGQSNLTNLPLVSPAITGTVSGSATYTTPTLTLPTVADFSNANHNHTNTATGGTLNAGTALQAGTLTYSTVGTDASWAFTDYSATSTIIGWSSFTTQVVKYLQLGKLVWVIFDLAGISNSTSASFTVGVKQNATPANVETALGLASDAGSAGASTGRIAMTGDVIALFLNNAGAGWTASGNKEVRGEFFFEAK